MSNKRVRSISFNSTNEADIKRMKLIGKKSFSRYIKKLLDDEIQRTKVLTPTATNAATPSTRSHIKPVATTRALTPKKSNVFNPMLK